MEPLIEIVKKEINKRLRIYFQCEGFDCDRMAQIAIDVFEQFFVLEPGPVFYGEQVFNDKEKP